MPDSCNYNMDSQYDRDNCNDCFNNENCRVTDCNSVCNLEYCENGEDTCEAHAIVDLYKTVFNKYKAHHNSIENPEIQKMDMDFSSITGTGENGVSRNLWNMLTSMYDIGTLDSKSNYVDLQRLGNLLKSQEMIIDQDGILLNSLQRMDSTKKRQVEMNIYERRKVEYQVNVFKYIVIAIGVALLFPALVKFNVLDKNTGMVIWGLFMIVVLIYAVFMLYVKNLNRDDIDFNKYNFVKPTDEEVARSRLANAMSDKDKAKCNALAEIEDDFDPASVNIDITPYISNDGEAQCFKN